MDISKEELYKAIGTKIRAMRTAKGWTQEELGNKFDVSPQYISRIERGSAHLSLQKPSTLFEDGKNARHHCILPTRFQK